MLHTLKDYLAKGYNSPKVLDIEEDIKTGSFFISDSKACSDTKASERAKGIKICLDGCDGNQASVESHDNIHIINIEYVFSQLKILSGKKCDCLLYSKDTIAFLELSCIQSYLLKEHMLNGKQEIGKKDKAYIQIETTIDRLSKVPEIGNKIKSFTNHFAYFSYREKPNNPSQGIDAMVMDNMSKFSLIEEATDNEYYERDMQNGFKFVAVKYPNAIII